MTTETFSSPGSGTWTCPRGCYSIDIECYGAGGGGGEPNGSIGGGGGGGGAYAKKNTFAVVPGNTYSYHVGTGGASQTNGEDSTFNTSTCIAKGGDGATLDVGGTGGTAAASSGDTKFSGGNGANGTTFTGSGGDGGGAGGGAGKSGAATNASGFTHGTGGTPDGGNGGDGDQYPAFGATPGGVPGGGGGGPEFDSSGGQLGADGMIVLSYVLRNRKSWAGGVSYQTFTTGCY